MSSVTKGSQKRWLALLCLCVSLLVISLDNTILNVALPSIASDLGATTSDLQWIMDAYILIFASLLLTLGAIGDRYGRRRVLQIGVVWFAVGSLGAGLATTTEALTAMRAFMGIGGAMIMPSTLSIITATFRDPKERSQAIGIWAAVFGLGIGLGPLIGGWLLERFDWNAVFLVNIPVAVIALVGDYFFVEESKDEHAPPPDVVGVVLSVIGLFALVYGIIEAGISSWTADNVLAAFGAAAVVIVLFLWWESRTPHPMLPVRFFRNMSFTGANIAMVLVTFSMFGTMFFVSQYFQSVQGHGALEAGLRIFPFSLFVMAASGLSSRISGRLGIKHTVGIGTLIAAAGLAFLSQVAAVDTEYGVILAGIALIGTGIGMTLPSATDSVMGSVPASKAGIGSAMNDTTRMVGGALGVAVLGTILNNVYLDQIKPLLESPAMSSVPEQMLDAIKGGIQGAHIVAGRIPLEPVANAIRGQTGEAFVAGMIDGLLLAAGVMTAAALVTFAILPARIHPAAEDEDKQTGALAGEPAMATVDVGD